MPNSNSFPLDSRRSRLFPVLGDNSKEGRATSILLSCLEVVDEFRTTLLSKLGVNKIQQHNIKTFTEVEFPELKNSKNLRPDGFISVDRGKFKWSAIVEAKIGKNELKVDQIEDYLKLARAQEIKSVLTISNQFSTVPDEHPVSVSKNLKRSVNLHHWSWMYILTEAQMLIDNERISDPVQNYLLKELVRFLEDDSTIVIGFVQMPQSWQEITSKAKHGKFYKPTDKVIQEVIGAWHQEGRDVSLILSRDLGLPVHVKISRKHMSEPNLRVSDDAKLLCKENRLQLTFEVPNAASNIEVLADLRASTTKVAMSLAAPNPKNMRIKGQVSWLLNQLRKTENKNIKVKFDWKGQYPPDTFSLRELEQDEDRVLSHLPKAELREFEVAAIVVDAKTFMNRKNFISTLEATIVDFYNDVGQYLVAWHPNAPKPIKKEPEHVEQIIGAIVSSETKIDYNGDGGE